MYKSVVEGKGGIVARVVADSISEQGNRITTFELEYHRFIHSELMTHRLASRNAMSSRAVPISKMIDQVRTKPAMPIHWGKNQAGMQASEECNNYVTCSFGDYDVLTRELAWQEAADNAANIADAMSEAGYHKQIVNRLLEPFQMMKTVLTATEFDNFFWLRRHKDAQPEIKELADCMYEAMQKSEPELLKNGEWHTPYVEHFRGSDGDAQLEYIVDRLGVSSEVALKVSASCCAQVSYRILDNSLGKALDIYDKLVESKPVHSSPFEHQASPMALSNAGEDDYFCNYPADGLGYHGVTHIDENHNYWSGNFKGWVQHRQLIKDNTCWNYEDDSK